MNYGGSRRLRQRFEYSSDSTAAFVELSPQHTPSPEDLFERLRQVPGVDKVEWQTTKTPQNNVGKHYSEQNILVYSSMGGPASGSSPIEFKLARNNHLKSEDVPFTVTVCLKAPSADLIPEAWRILRAATAGQELFPAHVEEYHRESLMKNVLPVDDRHGPDEMDWEWDLID